VGVWAASNDRRVYADGGNAGTNSLDRAISTLDTLGVGTAYYNGAGHYWWSGQVAHLLIASRIWTDEDVRLHYDGGWWKMLTPRPVLVSFAGAVMGGGGGTVYEDNVTATADAVASVSDALAAVDSLSASADATGSVSDAMSAVDAVSASAEAVASVSDVAAFVDSVSASADAVASVNDIYIPGMAPGYTPAPAVRVLRSNR